MATSKSVNPRLNPTGEFITRQAAAAMLSVTVQFIDKLCLNNKITAYRMGFGSRRSVRVRRGELLNYMETVRPTQHTRRTV